MSKKRIDWIIEIKDIIPLHKNILKIKRIVKEKYVDIRNMIITKSIAIKDIEDSIRSRPWYKRCYYNKIDPFQ